MGIGIVGGIVGGILGGIVGGYRIADVGVVGAIYLSWLFGVKFGHAGPSGSTGIPKRVHTPLTKFMQSLCLASIKHSSLCALSQKYLKLLINS